MLRDTRWSRALRVLVCLLLIGGVGVSVPSVAAAAAASKKKSDHKHHDKHHNRHRKKNFIPTEATAKKLLKVMKLAEDERFADALEILEGMTKKRRLKAHDKALIYQNRGLMLAALERYGEAATSFEVALKQDALPDATMLMLKYNLAQLYMAQENFERAIEMLNAWFENAQNPGAQAYFMLAAAYSQLEKFDEALRPARQAVASSKKPREQYMQLLLAVEFQNGNIPESLALLEKLVVLFPRKNYYMQLAYGYSNLGEEDKALAMLELAYEQGWLVKERELTNLAQRYLFAGIPYRAAQLIELGLEQKKIEEASKAYELLANALLYAREYDGALTPLAKAAELAEDGNLYVRLAQVYLEVENWKSARTALEAAIEKGKLRDRGNAELLLGISNFNEKRYKSARTAFELAAKDKKVAGSARKWLTQVERAVEKQEEEAG